MDEQREGPSHSAPAPSASTSCLVDEQWVGRFVVVSVAGVVDMLTAPQLEQAIAAALGQQPAGLIVDFAKVEFLASAGMGILVAANEKATPDVAFCVVADGPATSRPLKMVGIADIIRLFATRDEALAALGA